MRIYPGKKLFIPLVLTVLSSCSELTTPQTYSDFMQEHRDDYPTTMEVYLNRDLVNMATPQSPVFICLKQQRGRLYVDGQVAADWPVSTGKAGHETPIGTFPILEKKKVYFSSTWGTIVDENDICVIPSADSRVDKVPPGGAFLGAKMDNWQRLTYDGVGIHTGKVRAGQELSHGCIRTPGFVADTLFDITEVGSQVIITDSPEEIWPGNTPPAKP
ncbi:MAG: hypothetical protein E7031_06430 [Akkermansiaceae bacterium]|nr:hypothetical protein [Akkermansiaceae bacterium]